MSESISIQIGAETVAVPTNPSLGALNRMWPSMKALNEASEIVPRAFSAASIVAAALMDAIPPRLDLDGSAILNKTRGVDQMTGLIGAGLEVMFGSGVFVRPSAAPGEAQPAEGPAAVQVSTETLTP